MGLNTITHGCLYKERDAVWRYRFQQRLYPQVSALYAHQTAPRSGYVFLPDTTLRFALGKPQRLDACPEKRSFSRNVRSQNARWYADSERHLQTVPLIVNDALSCGTATAPAKFPRQTHKTTRETHSLPLEACFTFQVATDSSNDPT